MAELAFFIGKGGVGKTTVSAAYAVRAARQHPTKRVLLLSLDPAHSLADVLQVPLKKTVTRVPLTGSGSLNVWQVDAPKLFADFLAKYKNQIISLIDRGSIFSRADIEPLIDTTLPGMAEVSGLLAVYDAVQSKKYQRIVVDTAPFGHTLRLFQLPQHFVRFLNFLELAASRDRVLAQHFGGTGLNLAAGFVEVWRKIVTDLQDALTRNAQLNLVTTPGEFALNESLRCRDALLTYSPPLNISAVILNRAVTGRPTCPVCSARAASTRKARVFLKTHFPDQTLYLGEDPGHPIIAAKGLEQFAEHVFDGKALGTGRRVPKLAFSRMKRVEWPALTTPLSLVLGKGGVGKTTISAALGFNARRKGTPAVEICSVDPAPSLDDIFQTNIGYRPKAVLGDAKLRASEMDAVALFADWVTQVRQKIQRSTSAEVSGIHIDLSFERQLFSELLEIVPPGVDEIFAIFHILDLLKQDGQKLMIDMAPTGHALELLKMPERILAWTRPLLKTLAAHRTLAIAQDAAVQIAELGQGVRELSNVLRNQHRAEIHVVLLAELLPDRETERLTKELHSLQLDTRSMFINRVLFPKDAGGNCDRCRSAVYWQQRTILALRKLYPKTDIYIVRNFLDEIAGKSALRSFTNELWQLA